MRIGLINRSFYIRQKLKFERALKMRKRHIATYLLALINFICAVFHSVFQFELLSNKGIYRDFLLTENLVIAFVFAYFSAIIFFGKAEDKQRMVKMNIFFWLTFLVFVGFTQPTITSLNIVKSFLLFPQNYYLLSLGSISLILSLLGFQQLKFYLNNNQ
ncbi:hypothetical protein Ga0466249_004091 [Sporomusaceae bacterium BoRhaA]|nr:hypothetical protein [Pelorhabdus rhamnosifermentans]